MKRAIPNKKLIALCLIVKGSDEEALLLDRCLDNLAPYVDGIFITRTQPNTAITKVCNKYKAHLSDFTWVNDFAKARNFNFSQVPKDYEWIMWSDSDDVWRGLDNLRKVIEKNSYVDGFGFWYLYDWDEFKKPVVVHRKTMIVKNDGCSTWAGAIHEDLQPNRQVEIHLVEGIERLHLSDAVRVKENSERNVLISKEQVKNEPSDPRSYWNLANSQFGVSDFEGSLDSFKNFLSNSESEEEIYLAHVRLADVYRALGKRDDCVRELQTAIGIYPSLPDAYLQLAYNYYNYGDMEQAEKYCLQGMIKRPQILKMIVYNPRDYDYNPMMLLAKVYFQKSRPDLMLPLLKGCLKIYPTDKNLAKMVKDGEKDKKILGKVLVTIQKLQKIKDKTKLKKELDKLSDDIKSHPSICILRNQNFVKTTSSGRDLVIYCGNTLHTWNPELFKTKGFGGSEEAIIHLAEEWAKLGWNVTVYNNCGHKEQNQFVTYIREDGVEKPTLVVYKPFWEWNYRDRQDVTILWRWCKPLDAEINSTKVFVDLHDVIPEGEFNEKRLQKVDKIFVKTKFHRSLFPNVPDEKFAIVPNGMELYLDPSIKKDPYLIINTSSPDRSMDVLPKLFKEIKKRVPKAKCAWAYGWDNFINTYSRDSKKMQWMEQIKAEMKEAGIEDLGRLSQAEVGKLYQKASIFAYPTEFAEIDCISVKKAQASFCCPITTDFGALNESVFWGDVIHSEKTKDDWNKPYQFHFGLENYQKKNKVWTHEEYISGCVKHITDIRNYPLGYSSVADWAGQFKWSEIAKRWNKEFI